MVSNLPLGAYIASLPASHSWYPMTPTAVTNFQGITLGIALVGLVLSLRNTWRDYRRDKVRLRVIPKLAYPIGPMEDSRPRLSFEIINDSVFPVTVDEVGFLYHGTKSRGAMSVLLMPKGEPWPHRLEPLSSITVYSTPEELLANTKAKGRIRCAYVSTANAMTFRGHSEVIKELARTGTIPSFPRGRSQSGLSGFVNVTTLP